MQQEGPPHSKKAGFSCMYGLSVRKIHVRSQNFCQKCSKSVKLCSWNWRLKRRKLKWFGIHSLSIIWVRNWNMCRGYLLELNFWLLDVVRGIFRSHFYHTSKSRLALLSIQNSNGLLWKQYTFVSSAAYKSQTIQLLFVDQKLHK